MPSRKQKRAPLDMPPFPLLEWDGFGWTGAITQNTWKGFRSLRGLFALPYHDSPSDGIVDFYVHPGPSNGSTRNHRPQPSPEQAAAFSDWMAREQVIQQRIYQAVADRYKEWLQPLIEMWGQDVMADLDDPNLLHNQVGLSFVCVLAQALQGMSYIGCHVGCSWLEYDYLSVITHRGEIVSVGNQDQGFWPSFTVEVADPEPRRNRRNRRSRKSTPALGVGDPNRSR